MLVSEIMESVFYRGEFTPEYGTTIDITILKNPSRQQFLGLIKKSRYGELRGLLEGDLLVWDAYLATHVDIVKHFDTDGTDLHMFDDHIRYDDFDPDWDEEFRENVMNEIRLNSSVQRIYGKDVDLRLIA